MPNSGSAPLPRGDRAALARAVRRYDGAPLPARLLVRARGLLADLAAVEPHLPRAGNVVELGCGHGLFSNLLAEASPGRHVLGLDPDARKIAVARRTERPRLRFEVGDARDTTLPACDGIAIVDVLYLLAPADQQRVLERATGALRARGRLVVYAQERTHDPRFWLGYAQELLATSVGLTRGRAGGLHYARREEMRARLERCGLDVDVLPLPRRPYTDAIYVGRRGL